MIQPNELRIDNKIKQAFATITVIGIGKGKLKCTDFNRESVCTYKNVEPIPLTPEILEKCGFEHTEKEGVIEKYHIYEKGFLTYNTSHGWWIYGRNWHFGEKLKSLHQLQNLYFALTGEELNYKP